ncbi:hypothetical protein N9017_02355 [Akkermansiaceae bacterium]|nr:hypothetical protein [Akkermansiaceae bacterium]
MKSEPKEKKETSNMADFNFEEYSDVFEDTQEPIDFEALSDIFEDTQEPIDFEALSDIFEDTGVPTEEMAFESAMEAKKMSTATRSLTEEERAAKFPPVVQETIATEDSKGSEVGVMVKPVQSNTETRTLTGEERTTLSDQGGLAAAAYLENLGFTDNLFDSFKATDTQYSNTPHVPVFTATEQTDALRVLDNVADTIYGNNPELVSAFKTIMQHESGGKLAELGHGYLSGTDLYDAANAEAGSARRTALQNMENSTAYINGDREKKDMMIFDIRYDDQYRGANHKLGNTNPGDGSKYRGRGIIMLTGKNNYKKYGDMIGVDLVNNPDYMQNRPDIMIAASIAYLKDKGFDEGTLSAKKMARVVGHDDDKLSTEARQRWANTIRDLENSGNQALADTLSLNDEYAAQEKVGLTGTNVDGDIGPNSRKAMRKYLEKEIGIVPEGISDNDLVILVNRS